MKTWLPFLALFAALSSCAHVSVPPVRICTVAGKLARGGDCAWTDSDQTEQLDFERFMDFLEARPEHGAALCLSAEHWNDNDKALKEACRLLGRKCSFELRQAIAQASSRIAALQALSR